MWVDGLGHPKTNWKPNLEAVWATITITQFVQVVLAIEDKKKKKKQRRDQTNQKGEADRTPAKKPRRLAPHFAAVETRKLDVPQLAARGR